MRVFVYWNLQKGGFSIKALDGASKGRVVAYASEIMLSDAAMIVSDKARERIKGGAPKEVHAGFRATLDGFRGSVTPMGEACGLSPSFAFDVAGMSNGNPWQAITYNPHRDSGFVRRSDGSRVESALRIWGRTRDDGKADCYCHTA